MVEKASQKSYSMLTYPGKEVFVFDLILLGVGEDGHTASLFPGEDALQEKGHLAVSANPSGSHNHERITLTLPVINKARNILFMVTGDSKAEVIMEMLDKRKSELPAAFVSPDHGSLYFLLDKEAASRLSIKN